MDASEATKIVMSRIQSLDPENASKIMGYILIQDQGEKEMIRLAFSPDPLLLSYINTAKARFAAASSAHRRSSLPRIMIPNGFNLGGPLSPFHRSNAHLQRSNNGGSNSSNPQFYGEGDFLSGGGGGGGGGNYEQQFEDELPLVDGSGCYDPIMIPKGRGEFFPNSPQSLHRRSFSVNDAAFLANLEEGGGGGNGNGNGNGFVFRPCMYFARGFCKNGSSCKFWHGDGEAGDGGSPSGGAGFDDMMKMKALQQQRLAAMAAGPHSPFAYSNCMDENLRGDLSPMGLGACASSPARQIYLTFPADSMFKEEDVSNYFSMFGPVQDVRIPYQQKRMFGFVTFIYPETVKRILAKGNPHFVCDSRVLVKPYKEKGKVRDKKHYQQLLEKGEYSEHFDHPFGPRMLLSPQEMMLRKKLEQEVELQQAIVLESQRMLRLQIRDHNNHYLQRFPSTVPFSSPRTPQFLVNPLVNASSHSINEDNSEEAAIANEKKALEGVEFPTDNNIQGGDELDQANSLDFNLHESVAPKDSAEAKGDMPSSNNAALLPDGSPLTMASLKSCYLQMPRFASAQEAIEM